MYPFVKGIEVHSFRTDRTGTGYFGMADLLVIDETVVPCQHSFECKYFEIFAAYRHRTAVYTDFHFCQVGFDPGKV